MNKRYPFKFLDAYTRDDTDIFFGREAEIDALYEMVFQTDIIVVHGASGTGKTSLIKCGLAGRFQSHDWLDLEVRRGPDINLSLAKVLRDNSGEQPLSDEEIFWPETDDDAPAAVAPLSELARLFRAVHLHTFRPIYLIFDQFEELYVLGDAAEQDAFIQTVQEILSVEQPVKLIFSIREEYLGHLYEFEKKVPQLLRKKLRVEPMNLDRVRQVIYGATGSARSNVQLRAGEEEALTERIFEKIRGESKKLTIELPYLQVFLDKFYISLTHDESREAEAEFSLEALERLGKIDDVLKDFLEEQVAAISRKLAPAHAQLSEAGLWELLSALVTLDGTKVPMSLARLQQRFRNLDPATLNACVTELERSRILRQSEGSIEMAHDTLAAVVDKRRSAAERQLLEIRRWVESGYRVHEESGGKYFFDRDQLARIAPFVDKMDLEPAWVAFLQESHADVERKTNAEREEAEQRARAEEIARRAEEEARLRRAAEKARGRASFRAVIATVLAVLAIVAAGWAWRLQNIASQASRNARNSADVAVLERVKAEQAQRAAVDSATVAREQRELARQSEQTARDALARLQLETAEKERLQISAKTEIVESFLSAGYCALARKAMDDLQLIVDKNKNAPELRQAAAELRKRVDGCK